MSDEIRRNSAGSAKRQKNERNISMKIIHIAAAASLAMAMSVMAPESRADLREPGMANQDGVQEMKRVTPIQDVAVVVGRVPDREAVLGNIRSALRSARVNAVYLERGRLRGMSADELLAYRALIIAEDDLDGYSAPALTDYARRGGGVVFARYAKLGPEFMELAGLAEYGSGIIRSRDFDLAGGFLFNNRRLAVKGVEISAKEARVNGAAVFARFRPAGESRDLPLAWTRAIGEGGVLFWNTEAVARREAFRGFIVQSLHHLCRGFVTGLANVGIMMVDDLPGAWPAAGKGSARDKKALSPRGAWVQGIEGLERRFSFSFTSYLVMRGHRDEVSGKAPLDAGFHHEGVVVPPSRKGTASAKKGWELGLHGLSVAREERIGAGTAADPRGEYTEAALSLVRKEWEAKLGRGMPPFSCAIPAGDYTGAGFPSLAEVFPSLKVIRTPPGAGAGFGPGADGRIFTLPVISSGFAMDDEMKASLFGEMHAMGVVSHVISPGEFVRGNVSWDRFAGGFTDEFERVRADYPWLRWMTVSEAYPRLRAYEAAELRAQRDGKIITVHVESGGETIYFRTRLKPGERIRRVEGCGLVNIHRDSGDIIFRSYGRVAKVVLR
jgi:hypothetical protein